MAGPLPHWRSGTVGSGGEDVYFEVTGDDGAPAVVLTHGAGGSHAAWYQQVPALAAAGYRVVTFALAHPTRVRSLTLSNTVAGCWTDALLEHFRQWAADFTAGESRLGVHPAIGRDLVARDPAKAFLYQQLNTFHAPPMTEIVVALWRMRVEPEQLGALRVPVLVVTGADDGLFPPALVRAGLSRIDGARVVELPGAGHSPYFEWPDEYNAVLLDFLGPADRISSQ